MEDKQSRNIMINGQLIRQQGQIIQQRINRGLPEDQQLSVKFSNGWQDKFYQRHSFRQQAAHGESGSVQQEIINRELPAIREVLQQFQPQDIFNADESALFYNMPPNKTIGSAPGLKKNKTRITILLACNSTGSERLEPLFIGKHKQPRTFNKQTPEDLDIQYSSNNTAWMTGSIFTIWLSSLDRYAGQTPGRKILLLLDNFSGHGTPQEPLTELHNITIQFLPANTTSRMQPLDAGIIAAFKKHYRARQYGQALLEAELGSTDIYKMDILMAMRLCQQIWREFKGSTVRNCWRHTGLVDGDADEEDIDGEDALDAQLEAALGELTKVTIKDVVEPPGEEEEEMSEPEEMTTPPGSPSTPPERLQGTAGAVEEQIQILKAAQDILASQDLLTQPVQESLALCTSRLTQQSNK